MKTPGSYSLDLSPADLQLLARSYNKSRDDKIVENILKRLNEKLKEAERSIVAGGFNELTQIHVVLTGGHEQPRHAKLAVAILKKEGYNASYEHQESIDDGPNRSSPSYDSIVLKIG